MNIGERLVMFCGYCGQQLPDGAKFCKNCGTSMAQADKFRESMEDRIRMKCPYCGSERIAIDISWGKTADVGNIGLKYNEGIFIGVAQVYSDLCLDCKSILRTYVKDDTNKNWNHNPGTI